MLSAAAFDDAAAVEESVKAAATAVDGKSIKAAATAHNNKVLRGAIKAIAEGNAITVGKLFYAYVGVA